MIYSHIDVTVIIKYVFTVLSPSNDFILTQSHSKLDQQTFVPNEFFFNKNCIFNDSSISSS